MDPAQPLANGAPELPDARGAAVPSLPVPGLPQRYLMRSDDTGWYITCVEAPNVAVRMDRRATVSAQAARRAGSGTIFLDGAAQCEPFLDTQRRVYNLDHHEGCVRPFTLATCEQALILVRKGLDLRAGEWTVVCGEPDLDTVLAIWVLLNHARLTDPDPAVRRRLIPLIRVEGAIDALGLELLELTGLPRELVESVRVTIDSLRGEELALKRAGRWSDTDPAEYAVKVLRALDQLAYTAEDLKGLAEVEELGRVSLAGDRVAVVCRSESGIYEAERHLRRVHGDRVGLVLLQTGSATYTLRQVDPFLPTGLEALYERLNQLDPAVTSEARWGGSSDIGGSPRDRGTRLRPGDLLEICRRVYRPVPLSGRLVRLAEVVGLAGSAVAVAGLVGGSGLASALAVGLGLAAAPPQLLRSAFVLAAVAVAVLALAARRFPRAYGLRLPRNLAWASLLPVAALASLAGGTWAPVPLAPVVPPGSAFRVALTAIALAVACELLFRGALHGLLAEVWSVPRADGRWRLSFPGATSAVLSAASWLVLMPIPLAAFTGSTGIALAARLVVAGLGLGLVCATARERSGSLLAPVALHAAAAAGVWPVLLALIQNGP